VVLLKAHLKYPFAALVVLIVAVNGLAGWFGTTESGKALWPTGAWGLGAWLITIGLLIGCLAIIGILPSGVPPVSDWKGVLIDQRNRMSLSRFQLVVWTVLVISAVISDGMLNALWGQAQPLTLNIPAELWILLGLSAGTAVAAPLVLSTKNGTLATKAPEHHAWSDLFYGDDTGNSDQVDFSKVQQFFFTVILIIVYGVEIGKIMVAAGKLTFPTLDPGFLGIMAVSQVAYISYKALPQNKTDVKPTP
jgi:hypothetical protein